MAITAQSNRPAKHGRAVVFCCDDRFLPYSLHAACQIDDLNPGRDFDICIATMDDLTIPPSLLDRDFRVTRIATEGAFAGLMIDARRTESVYLRLALPEAYGPDYDRLLYLDGDIHVQGGDFSALIGIDMKGNEVLAVRDATQWRSPDRRPKQFKMLGMPASRYFNSGVMLMDLTAWSGANLTRRAVEFGQKNKARMKEHDQGLLNAILVGKWGELSPAWNWQMTKRTRLFEAMATAHIVHFIGPVKPWKDPRPELPPRFAAALKPFLDAHFPDRSFALPAKVPAQDSDLMRYMFTRNFVAAPKMVRYLNRFAHDLVVA